MPVLAEGYLVWIFLAGYRPQSRDYRCRDGLSPYRRGSGHTIREKCEGFS